MKERINLLMDLGGLRKEAGLSADNVAELSGIARSNIVRMENGDAPNMLTALKYARFLNLTVNEIWGLEEEKE
jgi:DNA-binding XRE family transcriptional regulator